MSIPRRARSAEQFPRPFEVEAKSDYTARCLSDKTVRRDHTPIQARLAAEREWAAAKERCLVSIAAQGDHFLVFGELNPE